MSRGVFVVLEGIDGSGTTSNCLELVEWLNGLGINSSFTSEPTRGDIGMLIRKTLKHDSPDPRIDALLFAADRMWHVSTFIVPKLREGCVVVCDRYIESSVAYQGAQGLDIAWILEINRDLPKPDLTVVLDLDPEVALARLRGRKKGFEKFENPEFLRRVREIYLERAEEMGYVVVDSSRPFREVQEDVRRMVLEKLRGLGVV